MIAISNHTHMVQYFIPYAYSMYHTGMVWYVPYAYGTKYAYGIDHYHIHINKANQFEE